MHPMRVVGVRVELPANQPVVLLREEDGVRYLPIWIGAVEATAIAFAQQTPSPSGRHHGADIHPQPRDVPDCETSGQREQHRHVPGSTDAQPGARC